MYNIKYYQEHKEEINAKRRLKYIKRNGKLGAKKRKIDDDTIELVKKLYAMDVKIKSICATTGLNRYYVTKRILNFK